MTVCEVCGGDKFTLQDGFYFCDECQTQSQDNREIVNDAMFSSGAVVRVHGTVTSEQTRAARRRLRETRQEVARRAQLSATEALNVLLRRCTALLVELGAPAQLPERTARLWERLLRAQQDGRAAQALMRGTRRQPVTVTATLCLLWLSLAQCDARYRLTDVLRWTREGAIPVLSAANEMPEDVTVAWLSLKVAGPPRAFYARQEVARLLRCAALRLPPRPPRPPLVDLLARLLAELALPAQLAAVVANVARRAPPPDDVLPEASALALLLVTLKLLLGLDDVTETCVSQVAAARNAAVPRGPRWFVFADWLQHVRARRAAAGRLHYGSLEAAGGPDPCRHPHRRLLFDFYRRDGAFRFALESPFVNKNICFRPEFTCRTSELFGRLEPPAAAPPPDADELLRPTETRLRRGDAAALALLRTSEALRAATVDYLLDERHVHRLAELGLEVTVSRAAARRRAVRPQKPRFAGDIQLVETCDDPPPASEPAAPPAADDRLRFYMPAGDVWCLSGYAVLRHAQTAATYSAEADAWPVGFRFLLEMLAGTVEMTPAEFSSYCSLVEKHVLTRGPERPRSAGARRRKRTWNDEDDSD